MKEKKSKECCDEKIVSQKYRYGCHCGSSNAIYGLSVIGALFYFLGNATSFGMVMLGIGKAIFWPAIFMFKLLGYLGM
ncbi:MAG: hypothetical protein PHO75_03125 [Candidatus Shapirobacteria bacterium]|nr:hypothetical protein [Candidatus Shapirobacteria bacterium]